MESFKIFYSWQSETDQKVNNYFIKKAIEVAIKKINKVELSLDISLDKDTMGMSGSPNITDTILRKISISNIFICDITPTNNNWFNNLIRKRKSPNANVLIELGYAIKCLGWERIICISNLKMGKINDLPFNIRQNRITHFKYDKNFNKAATLKQLIDTLEDAIKIIVSEYPAIVKRFETDEPKLHDIDIYNQINNICNERRLDEIINFTVNNNMTNAYYLNIFDRLWEFEKQEANKFITQKLNDEFKLFLNALERFNDFTSNQFSPIITTGQIYRLDYGDDAEITEDMQYEIDINNRYGFPRKPYDGNWDEYHDQFNKMSSELVTLGRDVISTYKVFRKTLKNILYI